MSKTTKKKPIKVALDDWDVDPWAEELAESVVKGQKITFTIDLQHLMTTRAFEGAARRIIEGAFNAFFNSHIYGFITKEGVMLDAPQELDRKIVFPWKPDPDKARPSLLYDGPPWTEGLHQIARFVAAEVLDVEGGLESWNKVFAQELAAEEHRLRVMSGKSATTTEAEIADSE